MRRKLAYFLTIAATAGFAACTAPHMTSTSSSSMSTTQKTLQAYHWDLISTVNAEGQKAAAWVSSDPEFNQPLTLSFTEDRVAIQNLCNPLMASYTLTERDIDFSQVASGMRMCADQELMQYEQQVGQLLPTATAWSLAIDDQYEDATLPPVLILKFDNGEAWNLEGKVETSGVL